MKYVYDGDNVSVYKTSDNSLVQSYTSTETEANEETGAEAYTTVTENHFGTEYTYVSREKSISYTTGTNTAEYSYQTTGTDEDEKLSADTVKYNDNVVLSSSYEYDSNGNPFKKIYSYKDNNEIYNVDFLSEYDNDGKITGMGYDNISTHYYYDSDSQLTRVDSDLNEPYTETFSYDTRGNIISRKVYDYTRAENISSEPNETTTFTYKQNGWIDQLEYVNGTRLEYDDNGNVTKFGNKEYTWVNGRNLAQITDGENTYSYTYDEDGIRTSKTVNGVTTYYHTKDGVILSQTDGTNTMYFQYDTSGMPLGFIYNGTQYFYMTNQMGDVIAINDCNGNVFAQYVYDEWGKCISILPAIEENETIANANPLRYRGYYLDSETGYYYLQSRYYDTNICRFINSDIYDIAQISKSETNGLNLFSYCNNNAINSIDSSGFFNWDSLKQKVLDMISRIKNRIVEYWNSQFSLTSSGFYIGTSIMAAAFDSIISIVLTAVAYKAIKTGVKQITKTIIKKSPEKFQNLVKAVIEKLRDCGALYNIAKFIVKRCEKKLARKVVAASYSVDKAAKSLVKDMVKQVLGLNFKKLDRIESIISAVSSAGGLLAFVLDLADFSWNNRLTVTYSKIKTFVC